MSKLFAIGLEVEEVAVGRVLRQLDGMAGVAKINLNLTHQKRGETVDEAEAEPIRALAAPVKPSGGSQPKRHNTSDPRGRMDQAIADALKDGELQVTQIRTFIQRRGFAPGGVPSLLNNLQKDGCISRVGLGVWQLTPAGRKKFFGNQKNPSPASSRPNAQKGMGGKNYKEVKPAESKWWHRPVDNSIGIRRVVLDLLREGPKTTAEVTAALVAHGKSSKNMSGTVYKMRVDPPGLVVNRNGVYSLTPHGEKEIAKIIEAEQSRQSSQPQSQAAE